MPATHANTAAIWTERRKASLPRRDQRNRIRGSDKMKPHPWLTWALAAAVGASPMLLHAQCRAQSADHQVAVFELYTSEGCDSCPPADRWFSALGRSNDASQEVALAFHVDYWDRLGWRDRFGNAAYTERQHEQATRQRAAFVYTPQVLLQGHDFTGWRKPGEAAAQIAAVNTRAPRAHIDVVAAPAEGRATAVDVHVRITEARDRAQATIGVALLQDDLASEVKAGENAGKRLAHDHVVRQWRADALRFDASGEASERLVLPLPNDAGPLSVAVLVENEASGGVLQAVAMPLCAR